LKEKHKSFDQWFKKDENIKWFDFKTDAKSIIEHIENQVKR